MCGCVASKSIIGVEIFFFALARQRRFFSCPGATRPRSQRGLGCSRIPHQGTADRSGACAAVVLTRLQNAFTAQTQQGAFRDPELPLDLAGCVCESHGALGSEPLRAESSSKRTVLRGEAWAISTATLSERSLMLNHQFDDRGTEI